MYTARQYISTDIAFPEHQAHSRGTLSLNTQSTPGTQTELSQSQTHRYLRISINYASLQHTRRGPSRNTVREKGKKNVLLAVTILLILADNTFRGGNRA